MIYLVLLSLGALVTIVMMVVAHCHGRNLAIEYIRDIKNLAIEIGNEICRPRRARDRVCGFTVGLLAILAICFVIASGVNIILLPFELSEWKQRIWFGLASAAIALVVIPIGKRINDRLVA